MKTNPKALQASLDATGLRCRSWGTDVWAIYESGDSYIGVVRATDGGLVIDTDRHLTKRCRKGLEGLIASYRAVVS